MFYAEEEFDQAVLPLRRLYTNMAVEMALHRDADRMRGEMLQELRMEVARLKGSVLSHEDRIKQLGQALRYAQNVANLLPNDAQGAAALAGAGAADDAAGDGGADPGGGDGAGADRRTRRRVEP